ncbi:MAG: MarC family protein, partial [Paracoccaceae bacterium]
MDLAALIPAFVTLLVVIDPIGLAPMFVALTKGADAAHRRSVALRACIIGVILLTIFGMFGEAVLEFVGISMPAFRVAGGILLFLTALDILFERRSERRKGQSANADDPSVFPLA